jgi:hypothetical protein
MRRAVLLLSGILAIYVCATYTVDRQFSYITTHFGKRYLFTTDYDRHMAISDLTASTPFRYRVFSDQLLNQMSSRRASSYPSEAHAFRLAQNVLICSLGFGYLLSLELGGWSLAGLWLMSVSMVNALDRSDLNFYLYTNLIFVLAAALLSQKRMAIAMIALTALAAMNREEAVFIPVLFFANDPKQNWKQAAAGLVVFACFFAGLRFVIGPLGSNPAPPGLHLLATNLTRGDTWTAILKCANLSLLSLLLVWKWPPLLKRYLLWVALPWVALEFLFGMANNPRLFLGPIVLVLIPATCYGLQKGGGWLWTRVHRQRQAVAS